jgi:hypothetical protein
MGNVVKVTPKPVDVFISLSDHTIKADPNLFEAYPGDIITWRADDKACYGIIFKHESPLQQRAYIIPRGGTLSQKIAVRVASPKDFEYTIIANDGSNSEIPPLDPIGRVIP